MNRHTINFSIASSLLIIAFFITTNYLNSPFHPWFLYASFPVLWWPISLLSGEKAKTVGFAIISCIIIILYYSVLNFILCPQYPWVIYLIYAIIWWPISLYFALEKNFLGLSVVSSSITIIFFIIVNFISTPNIIWATYPIFAILWWPLGVYYAKKIKEIR